MDFVTIRTLVLTVCAWLTAMVNGSSFYVEIEDRFTVFMRSLMGTISFAFGASSTAMISLTVWNSIFNTGPFWATFLGCIFLSERLTAVEFFALILSFVGVLLLVCFGKGELHE